jgi:ParB family transcriptional regulator, chromosome partitioning protein
MVNAIEYEKGNLYFIPIQELHSNPDQPRKYMDFAALDELTASVAKHGILEPILFRKDSKNHLYIIAGQRRTEASRRAGLSVIPAIFVDGNHQEIAIVENLLRESLTVVEEAEALKTLMEGQDYTQEQMSLIIGKARSTIAEILTLNRLPERIRNECRQNPDISRTALLAIARRKQTRAMLTMYDRYKKNLAKKQIGRKISLKKSPGQKIVSALTYAKSKIEKTGFVGWTDYDKDQLESIMTQLNDAINLHRAQ